MTETPKRKAALQELLAKVGAGDWERTWDKPSGETGLLDFRYRFDLIMSEGSLDAALSLHNAVLPGWGVTYLGQQESGWMVALARLGPPTRFEGNHPTSPALAWLCAILKALISECDE